MNWQSSLAVPWSVVVSGITYAVLWSVWDVILANTSKTLQVF